MRKNTSKNASLVAGEGAQSLAVGPPAASGLGVQSEVNP